MCVVVMVVLCVFVRKGTNGRPVLRENWGGGKKMGKRENRVHVTRSQMEDKREREGTKGDWAGN